jgi:predicted AlkP superfamily phosphohydrolase/phosphomutase
MTRTVVVGWDAATWRRIDPLLENGAMPNLAGLLSDGFRGDLSSTAPPMTPVAWTSIATGFSPASHGVYDFLEMDADSYEISTLEFTGMDRAALWDVFTAEGRTSGFLNYPSVFPPPDVDGFFVSGFPLSLADGVANPASLSDRLRDAGFRCHPEQNPKTNPERYYREVTAITDAQCDVALELLDERSPDLFWTVFMGVDWVQHYLWDEEMGGEDAVDAFYRHLDEALGRILDTVDRETNVVVVSDHGARRLDGTAHLNSLLEEWGYLTTEADDASVLERARSTALSVAQSVATRLPPRAKRLLKSSLSDEFLMDVRSQVDQSQIGMDERIDWAETTAFAYGSMGRVFVNAVDRYGAGTVEADAVEDVQADLAERFRSLEHPGTGEPLVERVRTRETVYGADPRGEPPDLLLDGADWRYMLSGDFGPPTMGPPEGRVADHDPTGVIVCAGPDFGTGTGTVAAADVAPTLLAAHGLPLVDGMDGTVVADVLAERRRSSDRRSVAEAAVVGDAGGDGYDEGGVEDHLDDLGYL